MIYILLLILLFSINPTPVYALEQDYFARIMLDQAYLYRQPIDINTNENLMFILPKTFFVKLISSENMEFYKVEYAGISGYIKKDCVQCISGTPNTPYMDRCSFRVYADLSRELRTEPTSAGGSSTQLAYIPLYSKNLIYLGYIHGEEVVSNRTDIWYYCKYTQDKEYYGYVYSDFCDQLANPLPTNNEEVTYISQISFGEEIKESNHLDPKSNLTNIVIIILTIPALIFAFLILKNKKIILKHHVTKGEVIDY